MSICKRIALVAVTLAVAALAATGCKSRGPGKTDVKADASKPAGAKPAAGPQKADPSKSQAWLGKAPLDEVGRLLRDLDSGDPVLSWHAEEVLGDLGAEVAARTRAAMAATTPEARAAACRLAYKFGDEAAIPAMIALLGDDSLLARKVANVFLCGLTDRDFNFRPEALPADRAAAQARWQAWYASAYGPVLAPKRK